LTPPRPTLADGYQPCLIVLNTFLMESHKDDTAVNFFHFLLGEQTRYCKGQQCHDMIWKPVLCMASPMPWNYVQQ